LPLRLQPYLSNEISTMNEWMVLLSALSGVAGAWLLYLASPQQLWSARRPSPRGLAWLGSGCLLLSLVLLLSMMGAMAAVASWMVLAMLVWTAAPFVGAWRARQRRPS